MKKIMAFFVMVLLLFGGCQIRPIDISTPSSVKEFGNNPNSSQKALVIGNADYGYRPLANPTNDAKDVANVLEKMGFYGLVATNLNFDGMKKAITDFKGTLTGKDVALFYFAGHGVGIDVDGKNYLFPTDNKNVAGELDVSNRAIHTDRILTVMKTANRDGINIIILDACRDKKPPYEGSSRNRARGWVLPSSVNGTVQAYATAYGEVALDNLRERNGLYTKYLLKALEIAKSKPMGIEYILIQVGKSVNKNSYGKQNPDYDYAIDGGKVCLGFKECRQPIT
jgi:hypothetical protein